MAWSLDFKLHYDRQNLHKHGVSGIGVERRKGPDFLHSYVAAHRTGVWR